MAKKVNKRQAPSGPAAGKAGQRSPEAASPPPATGGSPPLASCGNGVFAQLPNDTMGEVITYVYDGQNRLTREVDLNPPASSSTPDRQKPRGPKQRASRKRANGRTPKKQ
jgi:YD repeat-containing protein